jgi:hypothetical protein
MYSICHQADNPVFEPQTKTEGSAFFLPRPTPKNYHGELRLIKQLILNTIHA